MESLPIAIAGVRFDLISSEPVPHMSQRYGAFLADGQAARWIFHVRPTPMQGTAPSYGRAERHGDVVVVEDQRSIARLHLAARHAEIAGPSPLVGVETLLRVALQTETLERGGCMVHASAMVVDGWAHLVPGRSGSGKSTLAALAGSSLCDELCVLLSGPAGFEVHGTPWWRGRPASAPLAAVYRLAWDCEEISWLSRSEGLRHLGSNLVLPLDEPSTRAAAFAAAGRVARLVPFGRLGFRKDSNVDWLVRHAQRLAA